MNSYELIAIFMVVAIVMAQLYFFGETVLKIIRFKTIFSLTDNYTVTKYWIQKTILTNESPDTILADLPKHTLKAPVVDPEALDINLLSWIIRNKVTASIAHALNTYLIRNRGIAFDFHLLKDVVERNCDAEESDISQTISVPLYLGLLGTFLGILIGLVQLSGIDLSKQGDLDSGISGLLRGVAFAMIASFIGLGITVVNNIIFRKCKISLEAGRNKFYTFLQTSLLPVLNQNINSSLASLQNNLHKFNEDFGINVRSLSLAMKANHDTLVAQDKLLSTLESMEMTKFAKANIQILQALDGSIGKLEQFNQYLDGLNSVIGYTDKLTERLDKLISKTDQVELFSKGMVTVFKENQQLMLFLQNHYAELEKSHQLITHSVNTVGNVLDESLDNLKEFTQQRIIEVKKLTTRELDLMQNEYPEKWKKLDHLPALQTIGKDINDIKISNASQIGSMRNEIGDLRKALAQVNKNLQTISLHSRPWYLKLWEKVQRFQLKGRAA